MSKEIISYELKDFFNRIGTLSILSGIGILVIAYFFFDAYWKYVYTISAELALLGILCYVAASVDIIWEDFIKKIFFGDKK